MYKKILPALLLMGSSTAFAQTIPSLTAANVGPVLHDTFITVVCDTTGILPGLAGANIGWNFSALVPSPTITPNKDTGSVAAPAGAPGYSSLSGAALLLGSSTFATTSYATVTPSNTATSYYAFTSSKISQTGLYIDAGDNALYTNALDVLRFPFSYDSSFTDTYSSVLSYTSSGTVVNAAENGSVTVTGDAYGTLTLPPVPPAVTNTVYTNVLRVHSSQTFIDSANLFGHSVNQVYDIESYAWYQPGYHSPILSISTVSNTTIGFRSKTVSYASRQLANHEAVPAIQEIDASLNIYPNPANSSISISFTNATSQNVHITLIDMAGRQVAVIGDKAAQGANVVTCSTATLAKGTYLVHLQSGNETTTRKIEIQ